MAMIMAMALNSATPLPLPLKDAGSIAASQPFFPSAAAQGGEGWLMCQSIGDACRNLFLGI